jgi:hypothetical protein
MPYIENICEWMGGKLKIPQYIDRDLNLHFERAQGYTHGRMR